MRILFSLFICVLFATLLTGPRITTGVVTWFNLTCSGEKYIQYCTIIYGVQYLHMGFLNAKIPDLRWLPSVEDGNLTPLWTHVENRLPHFPKAVGPHPFLKPAPFNPIPRTCHLEEDNIGTLDIFFIPFMYCWQENMSK
jgi:hypothetical protein